MVDQPRPVWLTREIVDDLIRGKVSARSLIFQAWDAAPADAKETVTAAITELALEAPAGIEIMPDQFSETVLRALGMPR